MRIIEKIEQFLLTIFFAFTGGENIDDDDNGITYYTITMPDEDDGDEQYY